MFDPDLINLPPVEYRPSWLSDPLDDENSVDGDD